MTDHIEGPRDGHAHSGVTDTSSYRAVHTAVIERSEKKVREVSVPKQAYINHGRWVIDCECHGGGLTSPEFGISCCFDCGSVYKTVTFPKDYKKIERVLLKRSDKTNRNWSGETVDELSKEFA